MIAIAFCEFSQSIDEAIFGGMNGHIRLFGGQGFLIGVPIGVELFECMLSQCILFFLILKPLRDQHELV